MGFAKEMLIDLMDSSCTTCGCETEHVVVCTNCGENIVRCEACDEGGDEGGDVEGASCSYCEHMTSKDD